MLSGNVTVDLLNHHPVIELIRLRALNMELLSHLEDFYNAGNLSQKGNCRGESETNIIHHQEALLMAAHEWYPGSD